MLIGNSAFGYSFVIGGFLLSMGIGSWLADHSTKVKNNPQLALECIELAIPVLMLLSLPILSFTVYAVRQTSPMLEMCMALVCSNIAIFVIAEALILLALVGILVGMEIPLFHQLGRSSLGKILAGDYSGAFVAGVIFSPLLLPFLGMVGVLVFAAMLHLLVAFFVHSGRKILRGVWAVLLIVVLVCAVQYEKIEGSLFYLLTRPQAAEKSEVLFYRYTGKQAMLYTQDTYATGEVDRRLFLDGFLQWSTYWGIRSYHQGLTSVRAELGPGEKQILVLGGGDGLVAQYILEKFPQDKIQVVDFDCELLKEFSNRSELRSLAPLAWDTNQVNVLCADAFWYIEQPDQAKKWDLVLVDFPHGVGDAASSKVETLGFYMSLWQILKPGGYVSTHQEDDGTDSQLCLKENLQLAGFSTQSQGLQDMGFLYGKKEGSSPPKVEYDSEVVQSELRLPCWEMFGSEL